MLLRLFRACTIVVAFLGLTAPHLSAQTAGSRDEKEVQSYRITTAGLKKYESLADHLATWAASNSQVQAYRKLKTEVETLRKKDEPTDAEQARLEKLEAELEKLEATDDDAESTDSEDIDAVTKKIARYKPLSEGLRKAGMTPREYVVFSMALYQAYAFAEMKKRGMASSIPKNANAENMRFVETNAASIRTVTEKMQKLDKEVPEAIKKGL